HDQAESRIGNPVLAINNRSPFTLEIQSSVRNSADPDRITRRTQPETRRLMMSKATKIATSSIVVVAIALFLIKRFVIGYYLIPQNGMYPTLGAGSILFALKQPCSDPSRVKRGDIVVFIREQNGKRYNYIWRVVALPGEKV